MAIAIHVYTMRAAQTAGTVEYDGFISAER